MNLTDLLRAKDINPEEVLVFRHVPKEPQLKKVLPWLAAEKPELFNAYQQTQGEKLEKVMASGKPRYVASFIGHTPGSALFVGLYSIGGSQQLTVDEFWAMPSHIALKEFGLDGLTNVGGRDRCLFFDLSLSDLYAEWKGKLIVCWPPPEISWWRWASNGEFSVHAILEHSAFDKGMPKWDEISLTWEELGVLPERWKSKLSEWRGVYFIHDASGGKGYVGSAYGPENLLGRWQGYAASGHGDNALLKKRDPKNFRFTILQRVSPDMEDAAVIQVENSWKKRLHTRTHGLNAN